MQSMYEIWLRHIENKSKKRTRPPSVFLVLQTFDIQKTHPLVWLDKKKHHNSTSLFYSFYGSDLISFNL